MMPAQAITGCVHGVHAPRHQRQVPTCACRNRPGTPLVAPSFAGPGINDRIGAHLGPGAGLHGGGGAITVQPAEQAGTRSIQDAEGEICHVQGHQRPNWRQSLAPLRALGLQAQLGVQRRQAVPFAACTVARQGGRGLHKQKRRQRAGLVCWRTAAAASAMAAGERMPQPSMPSPPAADTAAASGGVRSPSWGP